MLRGALMYAISIVAIVGTVKLGLPGAGALCVLVFSFSTSLAWQNGLPWRFRRPKPVTEQADNNNEDGETEGDGNEPIQNEHHDYYRQGIRALKRLVAGEERGKKNTLAAVSKDRRFSLPEPKPDYEMDDYMNTSRNEGKTSRMGFDLNDLHHLIVEVPFISMVSHVHIIGIHFHFKKYEPFRRILRLF